MLDMSAPPNKPQIITSLATSSTIQVLCGVLVLFLQLGLQLMEAGSVRKKNSSAVFMRGLACLSISLVISWICGYAFSFSSGHYLLGFSSGWFGLHSVPSLALSHWFIHATVASLPSAFIAGCMAERSHLSGHLVLAMFLAGFVNPLPAHWVWHEEGWLHTLGCRDSGGLLMVHVFSGVAGMVGCLLVGPRVEKLENFNEANLPGHSLPLVAIGGMMVIVGMVAKVVGLSRDPIQMIGQLAVNSIIAGAAGGVLTMNLYKLTVRKVTKYNINTSQDNHHYNKQVSLANRKWSYLTAFNGFLTGMVAVSGAGDLLPSWAAFLAGLVGGLAFFMLSGLLRLSQVDDPVSGVAVNLGGGVVGVLVTGLTNLVETYDGTVVAWQVVGLVVVATWVTVCCLVVMLPLLLCGKLRIKDSQERTGVDIVKMEEQAYPDVARERKRSDIKVLTNTSQGGGKVEKEKNPACAFVTPNIRDQISSSRTLRSLDVIEESLNETTTSSFPMTTVPVPPPPPPYACSGSPFRDATLGAPEITVDGSYTSQDNSRMELLPATGSRKSLTVDVLELREALKQQKERLKVTSSLLRSPSSSRGGGSLGVPEGEHDLNNSRISVSSDTSIKSEVVKQAAKTASNKDNFNYLAGSQKLEQEKFELLAEKISKLAHSNDEVDVKPYESAYIEEGLEDTQLPVGEESEHNESSVI